MSYTYKCGNNGPTLQVDDKIKITKEEFKKGGVFSSDTWVIHRDTPGTTGTSSISKGCSGLNIGGLKIDVKW